jgi:hypothetical protein
MALRSSGARLRQRDRNRFPTRFTGPAMSRWDGGCGDLVYSAVAVRPHSAARVEAPGPDIIIRRMATSERTMTPATTPARSRCNRQVHLNARLAIACQPRSPRPRNPDQLRRGERYRHAGGELKKVRKTLDNKPQLKGRITQGDVSDDGGSRRVRARHDPPCWCSMRAIPRARNPDRSR